MHALTFGHTHTHAHTHRKLHIKEDINISRNKTEVDNYTD